MHRKNKPTILKLVGALAIVGLAVTSLSISQISTAADASPKLDFITNQDIRDLQAGSAHVFRDVDGQGTDATVRVVDLNKTCRLDSSSNRETTPNWILTWDKFRANLSPSATTFRTSHSYLGGAEIFGQALPGLPAETVRTEVTGLLSVVNRADYTFRVYAYDASENLIQSLQLTRTSTFDNIGRTDGNSGYAFNSYKCITDNLRNLDRFRDPASVTANRLIEIDLARYQEDFESSATLEVSFDRSGTPYTFPYLSMNLYDLDVRQWFQISGITTYQVEEDNWLQSVNRVGEEWRFDARSGNLSGADSFTKGRVMVNFENVSSFEFTLGMPANSGGDFASFEIDFSDGSDFGSTWTKTTGPAATILPITQQSGSAQALSPMVTLVSPLATVNVPGNRKVSLFGTNFDRVTEVYVGGRKLQILKQTANQIDVRLPRGLSGLVDLELKSTLNNVLSPKHFNYGGLATASTRKAELIVGGFAHNSRKLTARMQARIDRWLERNSDLGTLTCTGFTSLPRRTTDVALSTNRGTTACNFSKRKRPDLETSVTQGIEDPRPGSNVRRVRLVLTP